MKVVVLVGGVGGARFLLGVKAALGLPPVGATPDSPHEITALVNTGDDVWMHGLRICPDLDTCMYTLGGGIDTERGWGRVGESWTVKAELAAYGADPDWFGLGDKDIATHLIRSRMLRAGYPLSAVTEALCDRWRPGVRLLPMTDDRVETHVVVDDPESILRCANKVYLAQLMDGMPRVSNIERAGSIPLQPICEWYLPDYCSLALTLASNLH